MLRRQTGLFDATGRPILEGDIVENGMRVGDDKGWTVERAVIGRTGEPLAEDLRTGERGQLQRDPRLLRVLSV